MRVWGDQLAASAVPSDKLTVVKLKHDRDDAFIRLTEDGEEREYWYFQADQDGTIVSLKIHGSISQKLN